MKEVIKEPFIHLFSCSTGYYLYDVNTDSILKVTPDTYQRLEKRENIEENEQIRKLKKYGYLKTSHVQISEHPVTKLLPSLYENRIGNLTLQVTQQCNLRCDYCVYSGKYYTRTHSNKRMSFEMAKKGLDFLLSHSSACEELRVGFYGGEPLLEFELIKRCVEYMETQTKDKAIHYQITTNGTLLKGEILTYLIEKKFEITISFDGPKEIHDRYRKFAGSDKGSYDTVMQNARYIKEHYHNFFISNVTFNTVISPEESYSCIGNYFKGEELFQDAFSMYEALADFYNEKGYQGISHTRIRRYEILLEYLEERQQADTEYFRELMLFDLYARENLKTRPSWACDMAPYKKRLQAFYREEEENPVLLADYKGYQARQTMKMTHLEVFHYDILGGEKKRGEFPVLFDYRRRNPLTYDAAMCAVNLESGIDCQGEDYDKKDKRDT